MTHEFVYLLLLMLQQVLKYAEGSCVTELVQIENDYDADYDVEAYLTNCTYQLISNPHKYNLNPEYNDYNDDSVVYNITINISSSLIPTLERDSFISTSTINALSIENSQISEIENGAFEDFGRLTILKLPNNNLTILKNNTFISLVHLERLEIPNNKIHTLETYTFWKLMKLEVLDLSFNYISQLNNAISFSLPSLKELDLSHNDLTLIETLAFQRLNWLKNINLSSNQILTIEERAFIDLKESIEIDLSNNKIKKINSESFWRLERFTIVHLNNNYITELSAFQNLRSLTILNLVDNSLVEIRKLDFQKQNKLRELYLRRNRIRSLEVGSFVHLQDLMHLDLSQNLLTTINTGTFFDLQALEYLNLSRNHINAISGMSFIHIPVLQKFDLSRNELNSFSPSDIPQAKILDLQENPVSCTALNDLLKKWKNTNFTLTRGNAYGEISIRGIPCQEETVNATNALKTYRVSDFKNSYFVKYFKGLFQIKPENKNTTDELKQTYEIFVNTMLSNNNKRESALISISEELEELIKISPKIYEFLNLNQNGALFEKKNAELNKLIKLFESKNKSSNEYFTELIMVMKNISMLENDKRENSNDAILNQLIKESRNDLYVLVVINFIIIIMAGMFMSICIYFECKNNGGRVENPEL